MPDDRQFALAQAVAYYTGTIEAAHIVPDPVRHAVVVTEIGDVFHQWLAGAVAPPPADIQHELNELNRKADAIMTSQDDINAASSEIETEVADLAVQDAAILAAQNALVATIAALTGQGVNTAQLVTDTAALLTAQGADDATVAALTAAAAAPVVPPAPAG